MNLARTFLLASILLLAACDAASDIKGMFEKQGAAQEFMKKEYGLESQIGFNFHNGIFTQLTLVVEADDVRELSISELEDMAQKMAVHTFDSRPQTIYVQVAIKPSQKP
jgi:hypothetical protein